jgi:hypothetical protein
MPGHFHALGRLPQKSFAERLDLAAEELVAPDGQAVIPVARTASHPLLALAHAKLLESDTPRTAQHWVNRLPAALKPLGPSLDTAVGSVPGADRRQDPGITDSGNKFLIWPAFSTHIDTDDRRARIQLLNSACVAHLGYQLLYMFQHFVRLMLTRDDACSTLLLQN